MKIGVLYSRIRVEEKLLVQAMEVRGLAYDLIDVRKAVLDLQDPHPWRRYDVVLERCVSHTKAMGALQFLGDFFQKEARNFQKSTETERFLTFLKKARSLSR